MECMKNTDFTPEFRCEETLEVMHCRKTSPSYEKAKKMFPQVCDELISIAKPQIWIKFVEELSGGDSPKIPKGKYCCCLMTMGSQVEEYLKRCFLDRNSLKGILADEMASEYMFQMDEYCMDIIKQECKRQNLGAIERLEAPEKLDRESVAWMLKELDAGGGTKVTLTESGVLFPPRSQAYLLVLSEEELGFYACHDCSKCKAVNCPWRKFKKA